jgi:stress response protein YsnF
VASSVRRSTSSVCSTAENGPVYEDDQEITPELKRQVHGHYGIERTAGAEDRSAYGDYRSGVERIGATKDPGDLSTATGGAESDPAAEDEIRVQRSEEELRVGTREREAGAVRIRKRVRTKRERMEVPADTRRCPLSGSRSRGRR